MPVEPRTVDYVLYFYVKDFLAATATMSGPEAAAYALSLCVAWTQEAKLPADPERMRRAMKYDRDEWTKVWPSLSERWPLSADGSHRMNKRLSREWTRAKDRAADASKHGKKGANARWAKPPSNGSTDGVANARAMAVKGLRGTGVEKTSLLDGEGEPSSEETVPRKRGTFQPPTMAEVRAYCVEKGFRVDAESFIAHYQRQGWKLSNGNAMKDWRATVVTWVKREPSLRAGVATSAKLMTPAEASRIALEQQQRQKQQQKKEAEP